MSTTSTVITVTALTSAIKNQLETNFHEISVEGEITNGKLHSSGHYYFDLKDASAKISVIMFRPHYLLLSRPPKEGDHVVIQGSVSVYPPQGRYQIVAKKLMYQGVGELLLKFEALKRKLDQMGWFDKARKKSIPRFPKTIGVITSPTGAVIRDILQILKRRLGKFHLILNPVHVQGKEACLEIKEAIEKFNQHGLADVLIIARGGGSLEDLWPFNEEMVATAIISSKIPIISAIGHETDVTISDFVSDLRAPTPSAAAELVSEGYFRCRDFLTNHRFQIQKTLKHLVAHATAKLEKFSQHPLFCTPYGLIGLRAQRIDEIKFSLVRSIRQLLWHKQTQINSYIKHTRTVNPLTKVRYLKEKNIEFEKNLQLSFQRFLHFKRQQLDQKFQHIKSLDPKQILKRGYGILFEVNTGSVIVSAKELIPNKKVRAQLWDGAAVLTVENE